MTKKIYHILAPKPRKSGTANQFYRAPDVRITKTLCGQPRTQHDIRFLWAADIEYQFFELCPECERLKKEADDDSKWQARKKRNLANARMWRGD